MILHLLSDDKFTDYAISQFEDTNPKGNNYVVLVWSNDKKVHNIKLKSKIKVLAHESSDILELIEELPSYKAIIFHSLSTKSHECIINAIPPSIKTAWVFWGFELYSRPENILTSLAPFTKILYLAIEAKCLLRNITHRLTSTSSLKEEFYPDKLIFLKLDYCLTDLHEDYILAKQYFNAKFRHLWYNYYSIEETIGSLKDTYYKGSNILVGNSATPTNNHLEVFYQLKKLSIGQRKIIVPLSYGQNNYGKLVTKLGRQILPSNFEGLSKLVAREAYNDIIASCSIVIMYQKRHQGMGNILTALWLGAKVYLSKSSTTYQYFKRLGVIIFAFESDFNAANPHVLTSLDISSIQKNRNILLQEYGKRNMSRRIQLLVDNLIT